ELSRPRSKDAGVAGHPAIVDLEVAAVDPTQIREAPRERREVVPKIGIVFGRRHQHADAPHSFALLRPRGQRPCRRAAEQRDELAAFHSITSSARVSRVGGTSRPSALAVLRLIRSSNFVGCWTGRSAGLSPLRMRSTYAADRRTISAVSGP